MWRLTAAVFWPAAGLLTADDLDSQMKARDRAYAMVQQNAADPVTSEQAFYQGAIPGLLRRSIRTRFFRSGTIRSSLRKNGIVHAEGFGSVVSLLPGRVIVLETLPGTSIGQGGLARATRLSPSTGNAINRSIWIAHELLKSRAAAGAA